MYKTTEIHCKVNRNMFVRLQKYFVMLTEHVFIRLQKYLVMLMKT